MKNNTNETKMTTQGKERKGSTEIPQWLEELYKRTGILA